MQRGFTLLEVLVVLGIMALVIPLLAGTIRQLTVSSKGNTTRVTALVALEDAARALGRDIPQAQAAPNNSPGSSLSTLELQWTNWIVASGTPGPGTPTPTPVPYTQSAALYARTKVTYSVVSTSPPCSAIGKPCLQRKQEDCGQWKTSASTVELSGWTASATTVNVTSGTPFTDATTPTTTMTLLVESEQVYVSAVAGNTLTVLRGQNSTVAAAHAGSTTILFCKVAWTTSTVSVAREIAAPAPTPAITFTRSASPGYVFTVTIFSYPEGAGFPGDKGTYTICAALLSSTTPIGTPTPAGTPTPVAC